MNALQEAKLNMFRATQKHCAENATIVSSIPALETASLTLSTNVTSIIATVQQEDLITKGITIDKSEAKKTLCQLSVDIAAPIAAYATAKNNYQLLKEVSFSYSELLRTKDDQLAPRCKNIYDAAQNNIAALAPYGITSTTVTTLQNTLHNYQQKVPDPRNAKALKTTLTANLKKLFAETNAVLKLQMDKIVIGLKASHPDFIATYKTNRVIVNPSKTTTSLKGTITNAIDGSAIEAASILIIETDTKIITNKKGEYQIKPIPAGTYSIKISADKYKETRKAEIIIKQGQINKQDISLDAA